MILSFVIVIAVLAAGAEPPESDGESRWLSDIRAENRETRSHALDELRKKLESGATDAETIQGFLLAGFETDHGLRMEVSDLIDLISVGAKTQLIKALSDPRPEIKSQAALGLGTIGPEASDSLDQLLTLVQDTDQYVSTVAGVAISRIDLAGSTFPDLLTMLRGDSGYVRNQAAHALNRFNERVYPIVPEIIPLLGADDENLRYWLVIVVANAKDTEPEVVRVLARLLLADRSSFVRGRVAREFWEMGHNQRLLPAVATDALVEALQNDPSEGVKEEAAKALGSNRSLTQQYRDVLDACVDREFAPLRKICQASLNGEFQ